MKTGRILTRGLVMQAVGMVTPSAKTILAARGTTWGPRWVAYYIRGPGLKKPVTGIIGEHSEWDKVWGEEPKDFEEIATAKALLALKARKATEEVVRESSWQLDLGHFLYPGGVYQDGLVIGVSGAKGTTDVGIANILLDTIEMLCALKVEEMREKGISRLQA